MEAANCIYMTWRLLHLANYCVAGYELYSMTSTCIHKALYMYHVKQAKDIFVVHILCVRISLCVLAFGKTVFNVISFYCCKVISG